MLCLTRQPGDFPAIISTMTSWCLQNVSFLNTNGPSSKLAVSLHIRVRKSLLLLGFKVLDVPSLCAVYHLVSTAQSRVSWALRGTRGPGAAEELPSLAPHSVSVSFLDACPVHMLELSLTSVGFS